MAGGSDGKAILDPEQMEEELAEIDAGDYSALLRLVTGRGGQGGGADLFSDNVPHLY